MKKSLVLVSVFGFSLLLAGCGQVVVNNNTSPAQNSNVNPAVNQPVNANVNAPAVSASGSTLAKVLISDVADANGSVDTGKATFPAETPELAVSAYILKAQVGLKVTAELTYLPTGDKIGPVTNDTKATDDIISNFSFTKPTAGWPSGAYSVKITLSDGQTMTTNFNVP